MNLYDFTDYKKYLRAQIEHHREYRGYQGKLAEVAGCQASYFSRVLSGAAHLSPEQLVRIALHWRLSPDQIDYLRELLQLSRAGHPALKKVIRERVERLRNQHREVDRRLNLPHVEQRQVESYYFSAWFVPAIHVALSIPGYQTATSLASRLGLSRELVETVLTELHAFGLVEIQGERWSVSAAQIHGRKDSPYRHSHLSHWRSKAVAALASESSEAIHYSGVHSLSRADLDRLRADLLDWLAKATERIAGSDPETLVALNLDFFPIE